MRKQFLATFLFFICTGALVIAQDKSIEKLKDQYIKTYNPDGYNGYKMGLQIKNQGEALASSLSNNLQQFQGLLNTQNPAALLNDFNNQMQNIEALEDQYIKESNQLGFQNGQNLASSIMSGDSEATLYQGIAVLTNLFEESESKRALREKKAALKEQRQSQMSQIYWKAQEFNEKTQEKYLKMAAFSEKLDDENFNLALVENLNCFSKKMELNFSASHGNWLKNTCPKPSKDDKSSIENKFIAKDVYYSKIAQRKHKVYLENKEPAFREAAISFTAAAAKTNPKGAYFFQMGNYYKGGSTVLALSNFQVAKHLKPTLFNDKEREEFEYLTREAEIEIAMAIKDNNITYLNAFIASGLDKTIFIKKTSILSYAIKLDKPDAVQTILNNYVADKPQAEITKKLQKVIMLCAINNSTKTIQRFIDLGVSTDFKLNNYTPIDIAKRVKASDAFSLLINNSDQKSVYLKKYKDADVIILSQANKDPVEAAKLLDELSSSQKREELIRLLLKNSSDNPSYLKTLGKSATSKLLIQGNEQLKQLALDEFALSMDYEYPKSNAHLFIAQDLVVFDHVPLWSEVKKEGIKTEIAVKKNKTDYGLPSRQELIDLIIGGYEEAKETTENMEADNYAAGVLFPENQKVSTLLKAQLAEMRQLKKHIEELSVEEERLMDAVVFEWITFTQQGTSWSKLRSKYFEYYKFEKDIVNTIPFKEKQKVVMKGMVVDNGKYPKFDNSNIIALYEGYLKNNNTPDSFIKLIKKQYGRYAIQFGKPLDKESIGLLNGNLNNTIVSSQYFTDVTIDQSIAHLAFYKNQPLLFKALDSKFDLNTVKNSNDELLLESMLKIGDFTKIEQKSNIFLVNASSSMEDMVKSNKLSTKDATKEVKEFTDNRLEGWNNWNNIRRVYYSKDFDFNKKLNGAFPLYYFLKKSEVDYLGKTMPFLWELNELISNYAIDINSPVTANSGSLLHWMILQFSRSDFDKGTWDDNFTMDNFLESFKDKEFDKNFKNNNGLTAFDLFVKNEELIRNNTVESCGDAENKDLSKSDRKMHTRICKQTYEIYKKRILKLIK